MTCATAFSSFKVNSSFFLSFVSFWSMECFDCVMKMSHDQKQLKNFVMNYGKTEKFLSRYVCLSKVPFYLIISAFNFDRLKKLNLNFVSLSSEWEWKWIFINSIDAVFDANSRRCQKKKKILHSLKFFVAFQ